MSSNSSPPAGWYLDPQNSANMRWWNGVGWSDSVQSAAPQQAAEIPHSAPVTQQMQYHSADQTSPTAAYPQHSPTALAGLSGSNDDNFFSSGYTPEQDLLNVPELAAFNKRVLKTAKSARLGAVLSFFINPFMLFSILSWAYSNSVLKQTESMPWSQARQIATTARSLSIATAIIWAVLIVAGFMIQ